MRCRSLRRPLRVVLLSLVLLLGLSIRAGAASRIRCTPKPGESGELPPSNPSCAEYDDGDENDTPDFILHQAGPGAVGLTTTVEPDPNATLLVDAPGFMTVGQLTHSDFLSVEKEAKRLLEENKRFRQDISPHAQKDNFDALVRKFDYAAGFSKKIDGQVKLQERIDDATKQLKDARDLYAFLAVYADEQRFRNGRFLFNIAAADEPDFVAALPAGAADEQQPAELTPDQITAIKKVFKDGTGIELSDALILTPLAAIREDGAQQTSKWRIQDGNRIFIVGRQGAGFGIYSRDNTDNRQYCNPIPQKDDPLADPPVIDWCNFAARMRESVREVAYVHMIFGQQFTADAMGLHFSGTEIVGGEKFVLREVDQLQAALEQYQDALDAIEEGTRYSLGSGCFVSDFYQQPEWDLLSRAVDGLERAQHHIATRKSYLTGVGMGPVKAQQDYREAAMDQYVQMIGTAARRATPASRRCPHGTPPDATALDEMVANLLDTQQRSRELAEGWNVFGFNVHLTIDQPLGNLENKDEDIIGTGLLHEAQGAADLAATLQSNEEA
ncbi:MAG: hypothetical protein ACE5LU_22915, partial [Anaerolineae bacterium]